MKPSKDKIRLLITLVYVFVQVRNLELLKLRFGENNLHFCEVMIKDIADSKRINAHVISQLKKSKEEQREVNQQLMDQDLSILFVVRCSVVRRDLRLMLSSCLMYSGQPSERRS